MKTLLCLWTFVALTLGTLGVQQYIARQYNYHPGLGEPMLRVSHHPIYQPTAVYHWWRTYGGRDTRVYRNARGLGFTLLAVWGIGLLILRKVAMPKEPVTTHGSARWATKHDVQSMGLYAAMGVVLGEYEGQVLRHGGPEHALVSGPPRSWKDVGIVIPTLLTIKDSVIVHDIKGEDYTFTAQWRASFSRVVCFNPTSPQSARFNPLDEVRLGEHEVRDVQNVADILVDPDGSRERRDHWEKTSHSLLVGAILYVLYTQQDRTLSGVAKFLANPDMSFDKTLELMIDSTHEVVMSIARELHNKSANELSGVLSTAMSFLSLYRDPVIARATSASDVMIEDFRQPGKPVSLYLVVPPGDISRTRPLVRMLLNQIGRRLTEALDPELPPMLWVLNEFASLGRLDFMETALSYLPGYGIRVLLVIQGLNQLDHLYGPTHSFLDMCKVKVFFAQSSRESQRLVSDLLAEATVEAPSHSKRREILEWWSDQRFDRVSYTGRPLLTPGEVGQLPADKELILVDGHPPILADKVRYYDDKRFMEKVQAR